MEVIRDIVDLKKLRSIINIPVDFNYSKVEILILPVKKATLKTRKTKKTFIPEKFYGISSINNIDGAIQDMRDEWDRI